VRLDLDSDLGMCGLFLHNRVAKENILICNKNDDNLESTKMRTSIERMDKTI
jgi:hypothetical protein